MLVPRAAQHRLSRLADTFRVVIVNGPRQSGKTTLLREFGRERDGSTRSLDDAGIRESALADPVGFARYGARPLIIDEIQLGGDELVRAIKAVVDADDSPGQYVLSGSTRFLTVPTLSESLAGRAGFVDLWPFTVAERTGAGADFVRVAFDDVIQLLNAHESTWTRHDYLDLMCTGGYPEVVRIKDNATRTDWFDAYVRTILQRDVRSFANLRHVDAIPRLLAMTAARAGSLTVVADMAREVDLDPTTTRNYLSYLDTVFLTDSVPPWSTNLTTKAAKSPRTFITDPGLHAYLLGIESTALARPGHPALGGLAETFVVAELTRLLSPESGAPTLRFFKDRDDHEVDVILEHRDGRVLGIEVKAAQSVSSADARHLAWLRDKLGDRFAGGIVLYLGQLSLPLGPRLCAAPLSALWGHERL